MKRQLLWALLGFAAIAGTFGFIGYRLSSDKHAASMQRVAVVLADSVRMAERHAELEAEKATLARSVAEYGDRIAAQDAHTRVVLRTAADAVKELDDYRDSVAVRGDQLVPVGKLDDALLVIDQLSVVINAQDSAIVLRDRQIQAGAKLRVKVEQQLALTRVRVADLERVLIDLKPPPRPRFLGLLPVPSRPLVFLAGVIGGIVVTR